MTLKLTQNYKHFDSTEPTSSVRLAPKLKFGKKVQPSQFVSSVCEFKLPNSPSHSASNPVGGKKGIEHGTILPRNNGRRRLNKATKALCTLRTRLPHPHSFRCSRTKQLFSEEHERQTPVSHGRPDSVLPRVRGFGDGEMCNILIIFHAN